MRVCMANWWMNRWRMTVVKYIFQCILRVKRYAHTILGIWIMKGYMPSCWCCNRKYLLGCDVKSRFHKFYNVIWYDPSSSGFPSSNIGDFAKFVKTQRNHNSLDKLLTMMQWNSFKLIQIYYSYINVMLIYCLILPLPHHLCWVIYY